jgi:hypothetical protein
MDDSGQVWFKLAQWFQRKGFLKRFTDGRRTPREKRAITPKWVIGFTSKLQCR